MLVTELGGGGGGGGTRSNFSLRSLHVSLYNARQAKKKQRRSNFMDRDCMAPLPDIGVLVD